jgi:hypothetical protein
VSVAAPAAKDKINCKIIKHRFATGFVVDMAAGVAQGHRLGSDPIFVSGVLRSGFVVVSVVLVQSTDALKASMVVFVGDKGFSVASGGVELDLFRGNHLDFDVWCLWPLRQGFVVRRCELPDIILMLTNSPDSVVRAWVCS